MNEDSVLVHTDLISHTLCVYEECIWTASPPLYCFSFSVYEHSRDRKKKLHDFHFFSSFYVLMIKSLHVEKKAHKRGGAKKSDNKAHGEIHNV